MKKVSAGKFIAELKKRGRRSRIYRHFQLIGLEIAMHLADEKHKSLYIKMAKIGDADALLVLARRVGDNRRVKNKGAYFMRLATQPLKNTSKQVKSSI